MIEFEDLAVFMTVVHDLIHGQGVPKGPLVGDLRAYHGMQGVGLDVGGLIRSVSGEDGWPGSFGAYEIDRQAESYQIEKILNLPAVFYGRPFFPQLEEAFSSKILGRGTIFYNAEEEEIKRGF